MFRMHRFCLFLAIFSSFADCFAINISGRITDEKGLPVAGAEVLFVYSGGRLEAVSDYSGYYQIQKITSAETPGDAAIALYCYPNPFNRQTVVSFYLDRQQQAEVAVFDASGRKVCVVADKVFPPGRRQVVWDGLSQGREPVAPGLYVCRLRTKTGHESFKMLLAGGENIAVPVGGEEEKPLPKAYAADQPTFTAYVSGSGFETHRTDGIEWAEVMVKNFIVNKSTWAPFSTAGNYLAVYNGDGYKPFFIKGVNIGTAVPGSWPGQLAISAEQYARWFRMIADAGCNTIRIYTLHFPRFYEEFARYNNENPDKPLYLLHGVWLPEEYPEGSLPDDLNALTVSFDKSVCDVVDCMHGKNEIAHRYGEAYGAYTADISRWVLGYIIGREVHSWEIETTNNAHPAVYEYTGKHLSIKQAQPSEAWVAERLDKLIAYERGKYRTDRLVAFSSWPTLDPLDHPSQPPGHFEDSQFLDLDKMILTDAPGGFFVSYHAYPYYPNFINNDDKYKNATDAAGPNPYVAYLRELKDHYQYPVLISEVGVPSSYGTARFARSGMDHGGESEEEQGNAAVRLFRNIYDNDCGGAIIFAWMDEWFKTTWITHPATSDRRPLWHNICSPENNYGLIRFESDPKYFTRKQTNSFGQGRVSSAEMSHNYAFLNMEVKLRTALTTGDTLWIGIDTYNRNLGESMLPGRRKLMADNRAEFLLRITPDSANLYVTKAYNLVGITMQDASDGPYRSAKTDGEPWQLVQWQTDEVRTMQDIGKLRICKGNNTPAAHQAVHIRNDGITVRLPWGLLHFSDPTRSLVIDDDHSDNACNLYWNCNNRYLTAIRSDGVAATFICDGTAVKTSAYSWPDWELNGAEILDEKSYIETEKASLPIIRAELKNNPFAPKSPN